MVQPDIIHIDEEPYNVVAWQATRLARRVGARSLFFTWQNLTRRYPPPFRWCERYVYRHAAYAIAGNHAAVEVLRRKGYAGSLCVIPQFGVDPALYGAAQPPDGVFVIGYVGRMVEEKGVADLLRAAAKLDGNWHLRLLGAGPALEGFLDLAHILGISDRVQVTDQIPSPQVPSYLTHLHALVLPSHSCPNWKEQFGRVLTEAMASGVPVLGSDSGEVPNVIGDAGLIFAEGDVEALRQHLATLMADVALWRELAARGRARVRDRFTQARVAAETVQVYERIARAISQNDA
jgi:glycosyltransferase involved in cell wall biosynthesis